jgi:hypothetical protein
VNKLDFLKRLRSLLLANLLAASLLSGSFSLAAEISQPVEPISQMASRKPTSTELKNPETNNPIKPERLSDFAASPFKLGTATGQLPEDARLRIEVESPLSAEYSRLGDLFKARVLEDFYLEGDFRKILIPKKSWIRGTVSYVKKPRLLSRAGKLGIKLDSLLTPQGDYVPLDADLSFMQGVVNENGLLDPQTKFSDKAMEPTNKLLGTETGRNVSIATLGIPVAGTLVAGTVVALFSDGDDASVYKGQELQILVNRDLDLKI